VNDKMMLISGTASVDETEPRAGVSAQLWRTYRNITALRRGRDLADIIRTCYCATSSGTTDFNEIRTAFYAWHGLDPAGQQIQARLCREDLLIEIEAIAVMPKRPER
jgi:enamine deaminase RidA (YjgF/YER057c/UK114 family)